MRFSCVFVSTQINRCLEMFCSVEVLGFDEL